MVDRWIHYANNSVSFGYILIYPIIEILDVSSGIIFIWSTFRVVWVELADRFNPSPRARWLLAAKIAIFIVSLLSIYYNILYLALAIVWMQFMSLNTIADIATKRTQFEIAKGGFFFLFGLLTVGACSTTLLVKAKKTDGKVPPVWLAQSAARLTEAPNPFSFPESRLHGIACHRVPLYPFLRRLRTCPCGLWADSDSPRSRTYT